MSKKVEEMEVMDAEVVEVEGIEEETTDKKAGVLSFIKKHGKKIAGAVLAASATGLVYALGKKSGSKDSDYATCEPNYDIPDSDVKIEEF